MASKMSKDKPVGELVTAMCIIYGLTLLFIYFSFNNRMMPCFLDPLILGLLFVLLGIYTIAIKRRKRGGIWFSQRGFRKNGHMASDIKRFNQVTDILETVVTAMCIIYGLTLLFIYFSFNNRMMPCFLDPLVIGLLFFLLGIYPLTKKKSIERMKKRKGKYF